MEKIKILHSTESAGRAVCGFSKVVEFEEIRKRFKITHDTGNCFSNTLIYVMLPDLSWSLVADEGDIGDCYINYVEREDKKVEKMKAIYDRCIKYITNVFC